MNVLFEIDQVGQIVESIPCKNRRVSRLMLFEKTLTQPRPLRVQLLAKLFEQRIGDGVGFGAGTHLGGPDEGGCIGLQRRKNRTNQLAADFRHQNAVRRQLVRNTAQQRVVLAAFQLGQEAPAAKIGPKIAEQFDLLDAARHHRPSADAVR